jgi:hypothetical protein
MVASKYLLIYGGRNDNLYKQLNGNVALNDLHLFDLQKLQWITVALFLHAEVGPTLPMSRWGHTLVSRDESSGGVGSGTRILLLGGMNSKSYCEGSTVYEWCFDERMLANSYDDGETKIKAIQLIQ